MGTANPLLALGLFNHSGINVQDSIRFAKFIDAYTLAVEGVLDPRRRLGSLTTRDDSAPNNRRNPQ
jgi:hypothetical protein